MPTMSWLARRPWPIQLGLVAVLYFAAGQLGTLIPVPPTNAAAVWPAAGVGLVAVLLMGQRATAAVWAGAFAVTLTTWWPNEAIGWNKLSIVVLVSLGPALQASLSAALIKRVVRDLTLESERDIVWFLTLGGPIGCVVSATWCSAVVALAGVVNPLAPAHYAFVWWTWWIGDTVGVLVFSPILLAFLGSPSDRWRPRRAALVVPLVVGFALVTALVSRVGAWEEERFHDELQRRAGVLTHALERRRDQYLEVVRSIASLMESVPEVTRAQFQSFVAAPLAQRRGVQALGWSPMVAAGDRASFVERARREVLGFEIKEKHAGGLSPAPERDGYVPTFFLEPSKANEQALGFDLASEPTRFEALARARDSGRVAATAPITLVGEVGGRLGFLVVAPVYRGRPTTRDDRVASLRGYAVGAIRIRDIVDDAMRDLDRRGLILRVVDVTDPGHQTWLHGDAWLTEGDRHTDAAPIPGTTRDLKVAGRTWQVQFAPTRAFAAELQTWHAWLVLGGGLCFVGLLGAIVLIVTGRERRLADGESDLRFEFSLGEELRGFDDVDGLFARVTARLSDHLRVDGCVFAVLTDIAGSSAEAEVYPGWVGGARSRAKTVSFSGCSAVTLAELAAGRTVTCDDASDDANTAACFGALALAPAPLAAFVAVPLADHTRGRPVLVVGAVRPRTWSAREIVLLQTIAERTWLWIEHMRMVASLRESLRGKEVLLKEVHHRVKGNLQVISSLLNLQSQILEEEPVRELLAESQGRVQAIALVHEKLYRSKDLVSVAFDEYLTALVQALFEAYGGTARGIALAVDASAIRLPVELALPCGLVANELVSNALKHAFPRGQSGVLRVGFRRRAELLELEVTDDGAGIPKDFKPGTTGTLGLDLVYAFARQLDAAVEISRDRGTMFRVRFRGGAA